MTDPRNTDPLFNPDDVEATRGREQGLGVGARELAAQRDAGDHASRDDADVQTDVDDDDDAVLDRDTAVLGEDDPSVGDHETDRA